MQAGQPDYTVCRWGPGVPINPTDTTKGIALNEAEFLGRKYWETGPDGKLRVIKLVKNVTGSTLLPGAAVKYSTSAGRWGKDATICTDDTDPCCGLVEDQYTAGVPTGRWFRMIQYGEQEAILQTTANTRVTLAIGDPVVASADNGAIQLQNSAAANAAVQNRIGWALEVTTDGVDNGNNVSILVDVFRP